MRKRKLAPGEPVSFKIPVSSTPEEIEVLTKWRDRKILSTKIMELVKEELEPTPKISLPISRPLTSEEMERLANPEIQKMLGNICLALLSQQIPQLPVGTPSQDKKEKEDMETKTNQEWQVPDEVDDLIDDVLDDL